MASVYVAEREPLDGRTNRFRPVHEDGRRLSWAEFAGALSEPAFTTALSTEIASLPHSAFRWECPGLVASDLQAPCEFVVVDAPAIDRPADQRAFADHFRSGSTVTFSNLGGDATLVVPCPADTSANYAHLASFLRTAPTSQIEELWSAVSAAFLARVSERRVWLSTAGGGVPWLHVRLDDRPKYYSHQPYRAQHI